MNVDQSECQDGDDPLRNEDGVNNVVDTLQFEERNSENSNPSAADDSMQFPGASTTFFCSETKVIDFNVSHNFDVSKVEEDENLIEMRKVLLQVR